MEYTVGIRKLGKKVHVKHPKVAADLLSEIRNSPVEIMTVIPVSKDLEASEIHTCAIGSMMSVTVEARNVFQDVVSRNEGHGVIVAHNHAFQKKAHPSQGDREFLSAIKGGGSSIGVQVMDSIVIGLEEYYSFLEHGSLYHKSDEYRAPKGVIISRPEGMSDAKFPDSARVTSPKSAMEAVSFLKKETVPLMAVIHLTPDFEVSRIVVIPENPSMSSEEEARLILRGTIESPSTKYFVIVSNAGIFEKRVQYSETLSDRINHIRLGATTLCIPMLDYVMIQEDRTIYSFSENGRIFPRSRMYVSPEFEGLKMKGPSKVKRQDIPPYSWTVR